MVHGGPLPLPGDDPHPAGGRGTAASVLQRRITLLRPGETLTPEIGSSRAVPGMTDGHSA